MDVLIQPDETNDSLYICFDGGGMERASVKKSVRATEDVTLDFGANGRLIGLDIMNASALIRPDFSTIRLDSLLGVKEAATLVGVQKSNFVRDYANNPDFPAPVAELATGRVWLRGPVEDYLRSREASQAKRPRRMKAAS